MNENLDFEIFENKIKNTHQKILKRTKGFKYLLIINLLLLILFLFFAIFNLSKIIITSLFIFSLFYLTFLYKRSKNQGLEYLTRLNNYLNKLNLHFHSDTSKLEKKSNSNISFPNSFMAFPFNKVYN